MTTDFSPQGRSPLGAQPARDDADIDAIAFLRADHAEVKDLFAEYTQLVSRGGDDIDQRAEIVEEICQALTAHAQVEEEIFYPAARAAVSDESLLDEAAQEHADAKELMGQLRAMSPSDAQYDETVELLQQAVEHHVQQEENDLFPRMRSTGIDLGDLGEQMALRKEDVLVELEDSGGDR